MPCVPVRFPPVVSFLSFPSDKCCGSCQKAVPRSNCLSPFIPTEHGLGARRPFCDYVLKT